jgi:hypothetical protein
MADPLKEVRDQTEEILRKAVTSYGESVSRLGKALVDFGKRQADVVDLAKVGVDVVITGVKSVVENGWTFNQAYYNWILSLSGTKPITQSQAKDPGAAAKRRA